MQVPNSAAEILSAARQLADDIRERRLADEFEAHRQLPVDVVTRLRSAGVFRMNMPRIWEGPELTSMDQVRVIEALATADASVAWCSFIWCDSGIYSGYLEDTVARQLYPQLDLAQSGWIYPVGRADKVADGYRLSGRWMFGSGVNHCDMLAAGCTVYEDGEPCVTADGRTEWRILLAPPSAFEVEDTWYTTGLRGTGSHHYNVRDLVVPEARSFSFAEPKREGALWARPDTLVRKMSGVPLGLARDAINCAVAILEGKTDRRTSAAYRDKIEVQKAVATAELKLSAARAYVFEALEAQWDRLERGQPLSEKERADPVLSRYLAFQTAREVAQLMYDTVGGEAVYANNPFDRHLRDATTMCQHIVGQEKSIYPVGRMLLGGDVSGELFLSG